MIYRFIILVSICLSFTSLKASLNLPTDNCLYAIQLCKAGSVHAYNSTRYPSDPCTATETKLYYYFVGSYTSGLSLGTMTTTHSSTYKIYGAGSNKAEVCTGIGTSPGSGIVKSSSSAATSHNLTFAYIPEKFYVIEVTIPAFSCNGNVNFSSQPGVNCGDETSYPNPQNSGCHAALELCNTSFSQQFKIEGCGSTSTKLFYYFKTNSTAALSLGTFTTNYPSGYKIYGPYANLTAACTAQGSTPVPFAVKSSATNATAHNFTFTYNPDKIYLLVVTLPPPACNGTIAFSPGQGIFCGNVDCADCIKGFQPGPGKYIVSAWVKQEGALVTTASYTTPSISISVPPAPLAGPFLPSGQIIDGWQQIEGVFTVLTGATQFNLELKCSSGSALFDDIRIFPFDGSMMSYVYDPITLRLVAELDERNYAKLYEYDEEGKLIRIKKRDRKGDHDHSGKQREFS